MIAVICAIGAALSLLAEHLALWDAPWRLSRPASYVLGVATLLIWFAVWAIAQGELNALAALCTITGAGGGTVIIAYWVRGRLDEIRTRSRAAGAASVLSQDAIDRGGVR